VTTPFWFVLFALIAYAVAYLAYGRWYDRTVWRPDAKRTTPGHMYTDGVEFFPVSKYVLWGYQFKSVAALGPILGPFIALQYGWAPALIWIILGNFFIGWLQDYGSIMVSLRNQGRSFGPITYEFTGNAGRNTLLGFILFYLLIISATFIYFIATFWNIFPGTFAATLGIVLAGVIAGQMLYKARMNVGITTLVAFAVMIVAIVAPAYLEPLRVTKNFLGAWTVTFWALMAGVLLYLAAILPLPTFIQPVNYVSFFPAFLGVILILVGALASPATGVTLQQPAWIGFWPAKAPGPMWPLLFVAIACGAISGWHSLVGSSTTSKQLDVETDAFPVGAGAMLSEGLVALASLAAYMVLAPKDTALGSVGAWVNGALLLTGKFLGGSGPVLQTYFGVVLVIYAITVQALVTRFWRLVSQEVFGQGGLAILGQKHVSTIVGLVLAILFATTGSWNNLWLYFGGSNQLLAGLALMLITIHLARVKERTVYTLIPALFMILTTLSALAWQTYVFSKAFLGITKTLVQPPLGKIAWAAKSLDGLFVLVGVILFVLGVRMAWLTVGSYRQAFSGVAGPTVAADD